MDSLWINHRPQNVNRRLVDQRLDALDVRRAQSILANGSCQRVGSGMSVPA